MASALALANSAAAQGVPAECAVTPSPLASGSTIVCASPTPIGAVASPFGDGVEDLTVVIGTTEVPTTVSTGGIAVHMEGFGAQILDIETGSSVVGYNGALLAVHGPEGDLTVTSDGSIAGRNFGLYARSVANSPVSVTVGDTYGYYNAGAQVRSFGQAGTVDVNTSAGTVEGGLFGLVVDNFADADVTVTTAGVIGHGQYYSYTYYGYYGEYTYTGMRGGTAILARQYAANGTLTLDTTAGTVDGFQSGINVVTRTADATTITTANVTAQADGIYVRSFGNYGEDGPTQGGDLAISTVAGSIVADGDGIRVNASNTGNTTITTADVSGGYSGISVRLGSYGAIEGEESLTINTVAGTVHGDGYGIVVRNRGTDDISITTADVNGGGVTGESYGADGIHVEAGDRFGEAGQAPVAVTINTVAGAVNGGDEGIDVQSFNGGAITVTTGDVSGRDVGISATISSAYYGGPTLFAVIAPPIPVPVPAPDLNGDITVDSTAGAVSGGNQGIVLHNGGTGGISLSTADVTSLNGPAINLSNSDIATGGITVDTTAGVVDGGYAGILVSNDGTGAVSITTAAVSSGYADGEASYGPAIRVRNAGQGGAVTIDTVAGAVSGGSDGISVVHESAAAVTITTADVTGGENAAGVRLQTGYGEGTTYAAAVTIDTTAGAVTGGSVGIDVASQMGGGISITTADVTGRNGIEVEVGSGSYTYYDGTYTETLSTGDIAVDSAAGTVRGEGQGIAVYNGGTGGIAVTTAAVEAVAGEAISISNGAHSLGGVTVDTTAGAIVAGEDGIAVWNRGTGGVSITTAAVRSIGYSTTYSYYGETYTETYGGNAISVYNSYNAAGGVTVNSTAGAVAGYYTGIAVSQAGTGAVSITTADVTGSRGQGINVWSNPDSGESAGGTVTIDSTAGAVQGTSQGIMVTGESSGAISVTTADVTGESNSGIYVRTGLAQTGGVTIDTTAGTATGGYAGIGVRGLGAGDIVITSADVVGGTVGIGVRVGGYFGYYGEGSPQQPDSAVIIDSTAGTVTGGAAGIVVTNRGTGDVDVTSADVSGGSVGVLVRDYLGAQGAIAIDTTAGAVTARDAGVVATNGGHGGISIHTGDVTLDGETAAFRRYATGVVAYNGYNSEGGIAIVTTAGAITGLRSGISAINSGTGGVAITTADVTATGVPSYGPSIALAAIGPRGAAGAINAYNGGNSDAGITIDTVAGTVTGSAAGITAINSGAGGIAITTADVAAQGFTYSQYVGEDTYVDVTRPGIGISAINGGRILGLASVAEDAPVAAGGIVIDTTAGSVSGGEAGIYASNFASGGISITTADVTSQNGDTGGAGIVAFNSGAATAGIAIDSTAGTVIGNGVGIYAVNAGPAGIDIAAAGVNSAGRAIHAVNGAYYGEGAAPAGGVTINTTAGAISGGDAAIRADNLGTGGLSITTAAVSSSGESAIVANNLAAASTGLAIDTSAGAVSGYADGIRASDYSAGGLAITAGQVTGAHGAGIDAFAATGPASVTVTAGHGATGAGGAGVVLETLGAEGLATLAGAGFVLGATDGAVITTAGADIAVSGLASAVGEAGYGLDLASAGGDISVSGVGTITGQVNGLRLDSAGGAISVQASGTAGGITGLTGAGIVLDTVNDAGISLGGTTALGDVTGATIGIDVRNAGIGPVAIGAANVTGQAGAGISVLAGNAAGGPVTIRSTGTVTGVGTGILASATAADAPLSITAASVVATGAGSTGIDASGAGVVTVATTGPVSAVQTGIHAASLTGGATVTAASVVATGAGSTGIDASGAGVVTVATTGPITANATGIRASSTNGPVMVTAADVSAETGPAISTSIGAGGTGNTVINTSGAVHGGSAAIAVDNLGTGTVTINNTGILSASAGPVVRMSGSAVIGNNSGTITGFVVLTGNDDVLNNTGTIVMTGTSDFGGGNDVLINTGTIVMGPQGAVSAAVETSGLYPAITLGGLEQLQNTSLVDMRNGQAGNRIIVPGSYVGSGNATLGIDVQLGSVVLASDVLQIDGAASGSTTLLLDIVGNNGTFVALQDDLVLVNAGAGSQASAFTLGTAAEQGMLRLGLRFDTAGNDYLLTAGPSAAAYRTTLYAEGFRNIWNATADNWSRHMVDLRDARTGQPDAPIWMTMTGDRLSRNITRTSTFAGASTLDDLGYDQSVFGLQFGADVASTGPAAFGLTVGYATGQQDFAGGQRVKYDGVNVGLYGTVDTGLLFANILAKYDHVWADARNIMADLPVDMDGDVIGLRAEAGLTLGDKAGVFLEPLASWSYTRSTLHDFTTSQGSLAFNEDDGLLGKVGGRIGAAITFGGASGTLYAGGNYVRELGGNDSVAFTSGPRSYLLRAPDDRAYGEGRLGAAFTSPSGAVTTSLEGRLTTGGDHDGAGVSAMIRYRF